MSLQVTGVANAMSKRAERGSAAEMPSGEVNETEGFAVRLLQDRIFSAVLKLLSTFLDVYLSSRDYSRPSRRYARNSASTREPCLPRPISKARRSLFTGKATTQPHPGRRLVRRLTASSLQRQTSELTQAGRSALASY